MNFRPWLGTLALCGMAAAVGNAQPVADSAALSQTAVGFYAAYKAIPPGGIPDATARARLRPFLSPVLDRLLAEGEAVEGRYKKATKNMSPPLVEGDLFTSLFEGATTFRVGACETDAHGGHCQVLLGYNNGKDKPLAWTDTVYLVRAGAGWGVDDIAYGATWSFGNKGRLTATLKDAIKDGEGATE
jgi:hypothetical protein